MSDERTGVSSDARTVPEATVARLATYLRVLGELGFAYREVDVDASTVLRDEFSDRVPVILIDGKEHGYWRVEEPRFRKALAR